jgi:predicted negative regulator of RcsB-dependent stress response
MNRKYVLIAVLAVGGYLLYRQYQKRNKKIVRSGSMEYIIEKGASDE